MKTQSLIVVEKNKVELGEIELPPVGENDVLIETYWTGVSIGTERWVFIGSYWHPDLHRTSSYPLIPGYQRSGRVVEVGPGVTDFKVGDRAWCGGTATAESETVKRFFGGHTKHAVGLAAACRKIPDAVSDEDAALAKMAAISRHGIELTGIEEGDLVILIGLGMIGNMAGQVARARGARVIATEPDAKRREQALGKAADVVADPSEASFEALLDAEEKDKYDVMIDTSACAAAMNGAFRHIKRHGKVLLQGYYPGITGMDLFWPHCLELTFYNPTNQLPEDLADAFDLLARGKLEIAPLAERFTLADAVEEYPALLMDPARALSALIDWRDA